MGVFGSALNGLAKIQKKFPVIIVIFALVVTLVLGYGITKVEFEGDMTKEMPQQLPIYQLNNRITDKFGGQDIILILFELDDNAQEKSTYDDIRNPEVMKYMLELHQSLETESSVNSVTSLAPYIEYMQLNNIPLTSENIKLVLEENPVTDNFISENKKVAIMMVKADVGKA